MEPKLQRWVQRHGWDRAAGCYERFWRRQLQPAIDLLLDVAELQPGERVIDVASGTGMVTFPAARAVGSGGRVLATDLSRRMIRGLRERVLDRDLGNIETAACSADQLDTDEVFDVALCSLGLMYVPSPRAAVTELARVLRPGGRVVVSVWGDRRSCGWAEIFPIVDARVSSDVCPMFFALGAAGALTTTLEIAGFVDVSETRLNVDLRYDCKQDALGAAFDGGPVALASSRFDDATRATAESAYLASIEGFADGSGYRIPGEFVIASARRADSTNRIPTPTPTP